MVKNTDFIGSLDINPYKFRHYDISDFSLIVNGKQVTNEGLSLGMNHEKTSVMGYRTLIEASGIHHSNSGLQITHEMYIKGFYDLSPDRSASSFIRPTPRSVLSGSRRNSIINYPRRSRAFCASNSTIPSTWISRATLRQTLKNGHRADTMYST
jgi:hypothetical protein